MTTENNQTENTNAQTPAPQAEEKRGPGRPKGSVSKKGKVITVGVTVPDSEISAADFDFSGCSDDPCVQFLAECYNDMVAWNSSVSDAKAKQKRVKKDLLANAQTSKAVWAEVELAMSTNLKIKVLGAFETMVSGAEQDAQTRETLAALSENTDVLRTDTLSQILIDLVLASPKDEADQVLKDAISSLAKVATIEGVRDALDSLIENEKLDSI